jgi:hypothetical protein
MRSCLALPKLYGVANRRLTRLRNLFPPPYANIDARRDRIIAFVAIEALNLWASFARSYYISCVGHARTSAGARVSLAMAFPSTQDAIDYAVVTLTNRNPAGAPFSRRDEPVWHDALTLSKLSTSLMFSIDLTVQMAAAYPTTVFRFLPVFRNFFAHRNDDTFRKTQAAAHQLAVPGGRMRPSQVLSTAPVGGVGPLLADWLDDIQNVMDLLCH